MVTRDLDVWAVGLLLVVGLGLAGLALGASAADAAEASEGHSRPGPETFAHPFAGGVVEEQPPREPHG